MKKLSVTPTILAIAFGLFSCGKDNPSTPRGSYTGTFTVTYPTEKFTGQTTVELKNGTFSCSANTNRIPAGGSGTFSIDNEKITFSDENFWTADFDWNLILSGQYDYTLDRDRLHISANKRGAALYEYNLKRQ